eukprot:10472438-Ditylum_brightwellii.AAC.1
MSVLDRLSVFKYHTPDKKFSKEEGWQYASMHMIFNIKHNLRHKACFVVGGHVVDSLKHTTFSSTVQDISVRLMLMIAVQNNLVMMSGDIGNAFFMAPCAKQIWSVAGDDFGPRKGSVETLKRMLY